MAERLVAVAVVFCVLGFIGAGVAQKSEATRRIELAALKYTFSQTEIRVKRGVPTTLVLTSPDFPHGFSVPDLNLRADLIPGKPIVMTIASQRAGKFVFLCDNFCGEGHDRMTGFLVVED